MEPTHTYKCFKFFYMTKRILLIEGDASICTSLNQWLSQCEYDVVLATEGGDEGILLAVTAAPDLIIIDTDLSVIDGLQAIKILKASTVTQKIPIIALTVPSTESEWNRLLTSGCNACELKPVERTSILSKVKALTEPIALDESAPALFPDYEVKQPSTASVVQPVKPAVLKSGNSSSPMVVYVDDSPADSRVMASIVEGLGYGYENIGEPLKALPLLLELRPKLIFLDLVMPFTNGYEMCSQIRRTSAFRGCFKR